MLVGGKGEVERLAEVSGLLVQDDCLVVLRPVGRLEVARRLQLLARRRQQGQVPQLLVVALLPADADGVAVGLGAGEEVDGLGGKNIWQIF